MTRKNSGRLDWRPSFSPRLHIVHVLKTPHVNSTIKPRRTLILTVKSPVVKFETTYVDHLISFLNPKTKAEYLTWFRRSEDAILSLLSVKLTWERGVACFRSTCGNDRLAETRCHQLHRRSCTLIWIILSLITSKF